MRKVLVTLALLGTLAAPEAARAQSRTTLGVGSGAVAGALLDRFGPTFRFRPVGRAVGHHGMGSLRWEAGPEGGPIAVTGTDVAEIVDGRIGRLWVLLDPPVA
ncbi:hypothetical protein CTI14_07335 [Methylobacterium radiotolerans]|nr:hypothetical protein CTI14_07335 [Methylobacterium radiotolerans]